jgi:hypothetical protein
MPIVDPGVRAPVPDIGPDSPAAEALVREVRRTFELLARLTALDGRLAGLADTLDGERRSFAEGLDEDEFLGEAALAQGCGPHEIESREEDAGVGSAAPGESLAGYQRAR